MEAGDSFTFSITDFFDVTEDEADKFTVDASAVDTSTIGDYDVLVSYKKAEYKITVHVRDTIAPALSVTERILFTSEPTLLDPMEFVEYTDATSCTCELQYFERLSEPTAMENEALEVLLEERIASADTDAVAEQSDFTCEEEGIYLAACTVTDNGGNTAYEWILVVYDATAPEISGLADTTVFQDDITIEPEITLDGVTVTDNMDGDMDISVVETLLSKAEEEDNVYSLTVSCADRAGNIAQASCHYTVVSLQEETEEEESAVAAETSSVEETASEETASSGESSSEETASSEESSASGSSSSSSSEYAWVGELDLAQSVSQLIIVAAGSGSTATLSMYQKSSGEWSQILVTSAHIGKNGIGKTSEGDGKTPTGVYYFTKAFGNNSNPGTSLSYLQVDSSYYWVDDSNSIYYNQLVSTNTVTADWDSAEHIVSYPTAYAYCLALNYNSSCTPGKGSAIFLHCDTGNATAGCIAIPKSSMVTVLQHVTTGCAIIIDYSSNITNY